jgi:hypothetical protein
VVRAARDHHPITAFDLGRRWRSDRLKAAINIHERKVLQVAPAGQDLTL